MKKIYILSCLAGLTLTGCSLFGPKGDYEIKPSISGGNSTQKTAILEAINNLSPCVSRSSQDYFPGDESSIVLAEDDGDFIRVTTSQVYEDQTVELEWAIDETQSTFRSFEVSDEQHKLIDIKYPGFKGQDGTFEWSLKSAKCGKAVTKGDSVCTYKAVVRGKTHDEEELTIAQINKVTDTGVDQEIKNGSGSTSKIHYYPSTFKQVDYTIESPYFSVLDDGTSPKYHYVRTSGKVLYWAPDGNWMIIGDGDQVMEVYAGSGGGTPLTPQYFPAINKGYVTVHGNLSQYKGNVQIGFVTIIEECAKSKVTEPVLTGRTLDEAWIDSVTLDAGRYQGAQKQAIEGFMNSLGTVTGTIKTNSVKIGDSTTTSPASSVKAGSRFSFDVEVASGKTVKVAYDYHVDQDMSHGIFNKLKEKLTSGGSITLKGTMRFNGDNSKPFIIDENKGHWEVVPFDAAHIS